MPAANPKPQPVLVIGAGIGGLTTALALAKKGRRAEVFEQASEFKEAGAGLQVGPNAFRVFDVLGLTHTINGLATFPDGMGLRDALTGSEITQIPLGKGFEQRFGYPYGLMHRADLHRVLLDACQGSPLITLHSGQKLDRFDDTGVDVAAHMQDGSVHRGAALVGADGLWSTIRAAIVNDGKPRLAGHICYRAIVPAERVPATNRQNAMMLWLGPKSHLVHWPMRQGRFYNLTAVFHSDRFDEGWDTYGGAEELRESFIETRPEVRGMLDAATEWRMFVLSDREPIRDWSRGRVTLLGDAAHPTLQYLAQGACMAMEDAVCLANMVERHGDDFEGAFLAYQKARYLRTTRIQLTSRLYGNVYHAAGAAADLRNDFLRSRSAQQTLESMAWIYDPHQVPL